MSVAHKAVVEPVGHVFELQAEVKKKIKQAYCPPQEVAGNPCIEYVQYIVLPWFNEFEVSRDEKNGGNKIYKDIEELKKDYTEGLLHPGDLKPALSAGLNKILQVCFYTLSDVHLVITYLQLILFASVHINRSTSFKVELIMHSCPVSSTRVIALCKSQCPSYLQSKSKTEFRCGAPCEVLFFYRIKLSWL